MNILVSSNHAESISAASTQLRMHWCYTLSSAALGVDTYAVNKMRNLFHQQLMLYYKSHIQQASLPAFVILS